MPFDSPVQNARYCIEANERDLAAIERRIAVFRAEIASMAEWARKEMRVEPRAVERFRGACDDGLSDLLYGTVAQIEADIEADRALVGEAA